jgi:hypothetical protein
MIEPIFEYDTFTFTAGNPSVYTLASEGSGKDIHVHFCANCGTKLALTFERWSDRLGIYVGTLDDPQSIAITPDNSKLIFIDEARAGTILPPGFKTFKRHATENDGTQIDPVIHTAPFLVGT